MIRSPDFVPIPSFVDPFVDATGARRGAPSPLPSIAAGRTVAAWLAPALLALAASHAVAQATPLEAVVPPVTSQVPTRTDGAAPSAHDAKDVPMAKASRANGRAATKSAKRRKGKKKSVAARDDAAPDSVLYGRRDDVMAFAAQVAADRGLDRAWVEAQLAGARYQPSVAKAIMPAPAGTAKNWAAYRARFLEPKRIGAGVQWWQAHAQALANAQARYGVPPEIVAGIVGVETFYGRMVGHYRVLDALATLSFDFPTGRSDRSAFYRNELGTYLVWCALEHRDADSVLGSFAGAIGWPQFMPGSLMKCAVDFDHDGHIDLSSGGDDVIGSIANYLALFGWQRDVPPTFDVTPPSDPAALVTLRAPDIVPTFTAAEMAAAGAVLPDAARAYPGKLALVELQNGDAPPSYVAGTQNFYVVTRYNWSSYYAMAVIDLAAALKREMGFAPAARGATP